MSEPNGSESGNSSNDAAQKPPRALSSRQERKLVDYLDERLLQLTRNFKKRTEVSSKLQTLPAYLEETRHLLALILQIPPIDPSTSLRVAYLLRLTGEALGSIPGYRLDPAGDVLRATLQDLADFLDDLDQAWLAVLKGQIWDPASAEGVDFTLPQDLDMDMDNSDTPNTNATKRPLKSSPPSQTDLTRLRSLLLSAEAALEEWMTAGRDQGDEDQNQGTELEDVSELLDRLGLLDDFDSLFARTLSFLGGFGGDLSQIIINPESEAMME